MIRGLAVLAGLGLAATPVLADPEPDVPDRPEAGATGAVDPDDLPPLPAAADAPSSSATVLAASAAEEEVVVGAAKREQSLGNVASAVTVITADRIRRFGYRTVSEAITGVAGIYIQDTRLTNQVGIRGIQIEGAFNSRILVLVDGATVNESWGAFAGVGWDAMVSIDDIARIEVIRGPVGAVYGTNAFVGILNIVTRGAGESSRAWGRFGINSINGETATAGFAVGGVDRQLRGSLLVMNRIGETLSLPGVGDDLDGDGGDSINAALVGSYGGSFLQLRAYRQRREIPFAPYDSDPAISPPTEQFNYQLLLEGGHTAELSDRLTASGRLYGNLYRFADQIYYAEDETFLDFGDAITAGAELRARYELIRDAVNPKVSKLGITAGAEANYSQTESRSYTEGAPADERVVVPLDFNVEGIYTELDGQPTEWLGFTAGVRFDRNSVIESRVSPRAALFLAQPERYGLKLLYAEGFRNPSAFEGFFADGVDFSQNKDIKPETIRSYEAVLWAKPMTGLALRLSGFAWDADDVIQQGLDPDDDTLLQFQNSGRIVSQGVEAEASYRNSQGWYAFGGATLARIGSAVDGGDIEYGGVVNAPKLVATAGVSTPRLWGLVHVSTEAHATSRRETRPDVDGNPGPQAPGWVGWNAALYVPDLRKFDLTIGVRNLLGTRDLIPAPGDFDRFPDGAPPVIVHRIPGEGRELYAKLGYSY